MVEVQNLPERMVKLFIHGKLNKKYNCRSIVDKGTTFKIILPVNN